MKAEPPSPRTLRGRAGSVVVVRLRAHLYEWPGFRAISAPESGFAARVLLRPCEDACASAWAAGWSAEAAADWRRLNEERALKWKLEDEAWSGDVPDA